MSAFVQGQTDVTLYFRAYTVADGTEKTDVVYTTTGLTIGFVREREAAAEAVVGGTPAPAQLLTTAAAHTDWGFINVSGNLYRVDYPDALAAAAGSPKFAIPYLKLAGATFVQVEPTDLLGSNPRASTVSVDTTAIANAVVEAEIDALETYNRTSNTAATITGPTNGATTLTITTDATYLPIKSIA